MQGKAKTTSSAAGLAGSGRSLALQLSVAERFQTALFISAALHAIVLLGLQFRQPPLDPKQSSSLNVVLVNSKSDTRPDQAQALAQTNLDGGGNTDEDRLAKSPVAVGNADFKEGASPPEQPAAKPKRVAPKAPHKPRTAPPPVPVAAAPAPALIEPSQEVKPEPVIAHAEAPVAVTSPPPPPEPTPATLAEEAPPELKEMAQQEAQAREKIAQLEREARELMTQLKSERAIEQPTTTFTVPPDYRPRPSESAQQGWPPSPPPTASAQSPARVVKVEPHNTSQVQPAIQAPPQEERPQPAQSQPRLVPQQRAAANTGLQPTPRAEEAPAPVPAPPEVRSQPAPAATPAPISAPPPVVQRSPEPAPVVPTPPRVAEPVPPPAAAPPPTPVAPSLPEVKVVRLDNKFDPPEPVELRPQTQARVEPTPQPREETPRPEPKPQLPSAAELLQRSSEIARLEAQIAKNYDEYQKRPRRKFIGARTAEFRFAQYIEEWRAKVERVGNTNYPEAAKQRRIYGSLQLTVAIKSDGAVESVEINRSSGQKVLDAAAIRIVELAGPYSQFPPDISKDTDILHITRTWTFTRGDQLVSE